MLARRIENVVEEKLLLVTNLRASIDQLMAENARLTQQLKEQAAWPLTPATTGQEAPSLRDVPLKRPTLESVEYGSLGDFERAASDFDIPQPYIVRPSFSTPVDPAAFMEAINMLEKEKRKERERERQEREKTAGLFTRVFNAVFGVVLGVEVSTADDTADDEGLLVRTDVVIL
jgi:hypothetical protein